jgi:hypothetical protein
VCPLLFRKTVDCLDQVADLQSVENGWLEEQLIRWKLAEDSVSRIEVASLPEEQALCVLVKRDVPMLIKELTRLRPELK